MGLDVSHGCWSGAYSSFARFRQYVAEAAGIPLDLMEGFYRPPPDSQSTLDLAWVRVSKHLPLRWDAWESDPIVKLLHHSDCDGSLNVEDLRPIARRLRDLRHAIYGIVVMRVEAVGADYIDAKVDAWIKGLELAAERGERVEFR